MAASPNRLAALAGALLVAAAPVPAALAADAGRPAGLVPLAAVPPVSLETTILPQAGPAARPPITVDSLPDLDPDSAGALGGAAGGLGLDLWEGTTRGLVTVHIPKLPARSRSPAARDLMRRLLLSTAAAPKGLVFGHSLISLRLERLIAMGDVAGTKALLEAAPERVADALFARLEVEGRFLAGDRTRACEAATRHLRRHQGVELEKALVFCQALAGDHDKARLGLELIREQEAKEDRAFALLFEAVAGDKEARVESLPKPSTLHLAMMEAAGQAPPADAAAAPTVDRFIAASGAADLERRIAAAERAVGAGALPVPALARLYGQAAFKTGEIVDAVETAIADYGPRSRALLYQAARRPSPPKLRGAVLQTSWRLARERGRHGVAARVTAELAAKLTPAPNLAWLAGDAARAFYAAGNYAAALPWVRLLESMGPANAEEATAVWPLARLAGGEAVAWSEIRLQNWVLGERRRRGAKAQARIDLVRALFAGLREGPSAVPAGSGRPGGAGGSTARIPQRWYGLREAARAGRRGETVVLALVGLGERKLNELDPDGIRLVLASLVAVGLEAEARELAVEAALAAGL